MYKNVHYTGVDTLVVVICHMSPYIECAKLIVSSFILKLQTTIAYIRKCHLLGSISRQIPPAEPASGTYATAEDYRTAAAAYTNHRSAVSATVLRIVRLIIFLFHFFLILWNIDPTKVIKNINFMSFFHARS